jgi:hypothetical protein
MGGAFYPNHRVSHKPQDIPTIFFIEEKLRFIFLETLCVRRLGICENFSDF